MVVISTRLPPLKTNSCRDANFIVTCGTTQWVVVMATCGVILSDKKMTKWQLSAFSGQITGLHKHGGRLKQNPVWRQLVWRKDINTQEQIWFKINIYIIYTFSSNLAQTDVWCHCVRIHGGGCSHAQRLNDWLNMVDSSIDSFNYQMTE